MLEPIHYAVSKLQYPELSEEKIKQLADASEILSNTVASLIGSGLVHETALPEIGTTVYTYQYKTQLTQEQLANKDFKDISTLLAAEVLEILQNHEQGKTIKPHRLVFVTPVVDQNTNSYRLLSQIVLV